jgi:superfamily II DNA or RNA helicase
MSHSLRPYQTKAEKDIFDQWRAKKKSVMFQLCTGGGKTVLFVSVIKKFLRAGKRVVLIAHREELISQAWNMLHKHEIWAGIIKSGAPENFHLPCQVASIQTICRRSKLPRADLIIIDEAHHTQDDNSYGDVLLRHFPLSRVLGVTATPYRLGGKGFTKIFDCLVQGPPFKDLVSWGFLVPFKYYVSYNPDLSNAKVQRGDYVLDDIEKAMRLAPIVDSYLEHCKGMSGICFAVNISHSQQIVRQYIEAGIPAAHVDANTDITIRRKLFQDLRDKKILVLVNVGIATEGTDIPNIDFVQLARPTMSLSLFLQMVGRVTRPLWEAIKDAQSNEERAALIAASSKPYGIVLDNAGLYLEHGLPDQVFDWESHFVGYEKRPKNKPDVIEIIEFVAEDENGDVITSRIPDEVEGLKLIEVNYIAKEKIINLVSLKEFDKQHAIFKNLPQVNKAGILAYQKYCEHCRKNSFYMSDEVWRYLEKKLVKEPEEEIIKLNRRYNQDVEIIKLNNEPGQVKALLEARTSTHNAALKRIEKGAAPRGYLAKEKEKYFFDNKIPVSA